MRELDKAFPLTVPSRAFMPSVAFWQGLHHGLGKEWQS